MAKSDREAEKRRKQRQEALRRQRAKATSSSGFPEKRFSGAKRQRGLRPGQRQAGGWEKLLGGLRGPGGAAPPAGPAREAAARQVARGRDTAGTVPQARPTTATVGAAAPQPPAPRLAPRSPSVLSSPAFRGEQGFGEQRYPAQTLARTPARTPAQTLARTPAQTPALAPRRANLPGKQGFGAQRHLTQTPAPALAPRRANLPGKQGFGAQRYPAQTPARTPAQTPAPPQMNMNQRNALSQVLPGQFPGPPGTPMDPRVARMQARNAQVPVAPPAPRQPPFDPRAFLGSSQPPGLAGLNPVQRRQAGFGPEPARRYDPRMEAIANMVPGAQGSPAQQRIMAIIEALSRVRG